MIFASQETARAELEASSGYGSYGSGLVAETVAEEPFIGPLGSSPGRQLQYQCEVCFSPTTTRCKQCKAVRYCSRKCQIFHWRQGHKDDCRAVTTDQNIDAGVHSCLNEFKQDEIRSSRNGIQAMDSIKPVEFSSGKRKFSNPILHELGENNDTEAETSDGWKKPDMNMKASVNSLPDECSSSTISVDMSVASDSNFKSVNRNDGPSTLMNMESTRPILSEQPSLTNPKHGPAASSVSYQLKPGYIDTNEKSESSTSPGCSAAGSEEHLHSEPSTPSDFWGGTIEPIKSNINAFKFDDANMSNSRSSCLPSSGKTNVRVEMLGADMNRVPTDDPSPATSIPRKSISISEVSEDGFKSRGPVFFKLPDQYGGSITSAECSSKEEVKLSSSNVPNKYVTDFSSLQSVSPKLVDHEVDGSNGFPDTLKSQRNDSSRLGSSEAHLSSRACTRKTAILDVQSLENERPKMVDHEVDGANGFSDTLKNQRNDSSRVRSSEAHLSSRACTRKTAILDSQSLENERSNGDASCSLDSRGYACIATSGTNPSELRASTFIKHGSLGTGGGIMGRYEGSFPYELFVKLYNWNKVELRPCGLKNCGNSCYANAVLQCLAFTPPLTAYFLQGLHAKACHKKEWCFTCEFEVLVKKAKEGNYPLSPARIMSQMQHVASHLVHGKEEDAHEFLRYAIDAMQLVCLKEAGVKVPTSLDEETTLLGLTFGGYLQSKIECMRCGGISKQHERIMDLTIEIGGEIGTLEDALRQFTRSEILDGENKYRCGRCKSYEKAKKKLRVLEAPNVLTIALKRFQSGKYGKLNKSVKFPEILNLAPYMRGTSDKSPIYQLYGAVVHLDVMNATFSGHYVCYIKNNQGRWFKADDSMMMSFKTTYSVVSHNSISSAYDDRRCKWWSSKKFCRTTRTCFSTQGKMLRNLLICVIPLPQLVWSSHRLTINSTIRCSPRAPKLIRSSMIHHDPRKSKNPTGAFKFHPTEPWDVSIAELNNHTSNGELYRTSFRPTRSEDDLLTEYSSFFSETGSHSTESSNRESTSTDDSTLFGDMGNGWNRPSRSTTSDSDTPSPSSSLSPLRTRHSPLADLDRYSSDAETSSASSVNVSSKNDGDVFWARASSSIMCEPSNKEFSRRDNKSDRLGSDESRDNNVKGVYVRRSMR
ncbi:hypothetical protein DH2020_035536 [Rehmannia glutinosa]|uniref:Ubiquitin carboxyl-terminal hydrolase n=1 Tax=Rehmannia glutinosa TaxID=99300 RepID=A0ABR0V656_REHGL